MKRVRLFCFHTAGGRRGAARLREAGYTVQLAPVGMASLRAMRAKPPDAVVIDLARQPSIGRDMAIAVRQYKATRRVPLVFVGGEPEKTAAIRRTLPDAVFTAWPRVRSALRSAIAARPADPVVPGSMLAGYSGTPLPKKLGIKPGSLVALVNAPDGFERTLGALPDGAQLRRDARGRRDLTVWFVRSSRSLRGRLPRMVPLSERGGLWIAWPKKASGMSTDLSQAEVREKGLAAGMVDFKICAVDGTWTGLRFSWRKSAP